MRGRGYFGTGYRVCVLGSAFPDAFPQLRLYFHGYALATTIRISLSPGPHKTPRALALNWRPESNKWFRFGWFRVYGLEFRV